jgi:hypothetical protein
MNAATASEIARLKTLTITQIVRQFESLFGEKCRSRNKRYLIRRIAWRLQANAEGDLSERAKARATELALDSEEHETSIKTDQQETARTTDRGRDRTATRTSIYDAPNIDPMTQQSTSSQRHPDNQQPPYAAQFSTQQSGNVSTSTPVGGVVTLPLLLPEKAPTYTRQRAGCVRQTCSQPVLAKLIERDYRHTTHRQGQAYMMPQHRVSQTEAV